MNSLLRLAQLIIKTQCNDRTRSEFAKISAQNANKAERNVVRAISVSVSEGIHL